MMTLKDFAKSRDLTLPKLKNLCQELLGTVPEELTELDIEKLDTGLATASQSLLPAGEQDTSLTKHSPLTETPDTVERVTEIVGVKTLQKNLLLYLQLVKTALQGKKFEQDSLAFQMEQAFYGDLASYQKLTFQDSLGRMNKASSMTHWDAIRSLTPNPDDAEDCSLQAEIIALMDTLGL
ncbi:hypothetical protein [Nostoc sp. CHAB 5715]|uniref:hypothetical protein n=1 Tax=Nostoc sp. CHAB 5715 TaxID=2780400 RepID=UPI001E49106E|nr:hypothetical protein [Nostoc sp. CHAB 5715]MCC5624056.1 hypothetical protein [Nostoc sp. CHAB 5715]